MGDSDRTQEQLLQEIERLRQQVARLEASNAEQLCLEQALRESEQSLRLLAQQFPAMLWTTDRNLLITSAIGSGFVLIDTIPEQYIGTSLYDLFGISDETYPPIAAHRRALQGEPSSYDSAANPKGRMFQCRVEPYRDLSGEIIGTIGIAVDISERRQVEMALRASEERFRVLVQNSSDVICMLEADGTIRYISDSVERFIGYRPQELIGTNAFELIHPEDLPHILEMFVSGVQQPGIILSAEYRFRCKDGTWCILESTGSNMLQDPMIGGIVINSRDITERKRTEKERDRLYVAARTALEIRDQFLSLVRHELGTPMTVLLGYTQLLQRRLAGSISEENEKLLRMQAEQVTRMHRLIGSLLDLPGIQDGQLSLERQPLELGPLARRVVDGMLPVLQQHQLVLHEPREPLVVEGDPVRLEQVLHNLLQNAIKYSPDGGLIEVVLQEQEGQALISVRDSGIGIPPEDKPKLFQRFYRASNVEPGHLRGMGMGLYVVSEIVTLHGGSVAVDSAVGQGSTFTIKLPLFDPTALPQAQTSDQVSQS